MVGTRWNDWKTMPILAPRTSASWSSLRLDEIVAGDPHLARRGPLQAGDDHQQRGLARAAGADDGDRFARRNARSTPLQDLHRPGAAGQGERHVVQGDDGFGHDSQQAPARGLAPSFASFYFSTADKAHGDGRLRCGQLPSNATLANMVFRVLLCNWLIAALAAGHRRSHGGAPVRIVVLGDSLVAGFQLKASDAFPAQLERALKAEGHAVEVINAGVSGDTTANGLERLRWAVPERTDAVILELGANDALRGLDPGAGQGQPRQDHHRAEGERRRGAAGRHARPAQPRRGLRARVRRHLSRARQEARADPLSVLPRRHRAQRQAQPRRRHPSQPARASPRSPSGSCRRSSS